MPDQVESLVLQIRSGDVLEASRRLRALVGDSNRAEGASRRLATASGGLGQSIKRMLPGIVAAGTAMAAFRKALDVGVATQDFKAQLKTATGSVENAAEAFEALEDFASRTPYALEQSLEAFTKLTNLGLTPSERALESYGNTASAMGKDLTQLIEAVADATTNEFERLKEFGIKTKQEGDKVSFTFRGVTKTIGKNAQEIEDYLIALGENEFAGAMADRMDTLGGKMSNLGDKWNQLWRTINDAGVGDLLADSVQVGLDVLEELNAMLDSGQIQAELKSWVVAFEDWADDFQGIVEWATGIFEGATDQWEIDGKSAWEEIIKTLKLIPATVRYWMQRVGIEIAAIGTYAGAAGKEMVLVFVEEFKRLLAAAKNYGVAIGKALNPFDDVGFKEAFKAGVDAQKEVARETAKKVAEIHKETNDTIRYMQEGRIAALEEIAIEFGKSERKVDTLVQKSKELRRAYEEEKVAKELARGDRTEKFKIKPDSVPTLLARPVGGEAYGPQDASEDFKKLAEQLQSEERALESSYLKRLEIVRKNTSAGSEIRAELEAKLGQEYESSLAKFEERQIAELDFMRDGWALQLDELKDFYSRRHQIIMDSEALTGEEKKKMSAKLERERLDIIAGMEQERVMQGLDVAKNMFAGYAALAESNNKTLSRIGKAALKAQKAVAITQAIIDTYKSANSAYSAMAGIPVVGPALGVAAAGAAIAAGLANVAAIRSAPSGGSFEQGGIVPGQSYAGDNITAQVNSGEMILNRQQQANLFKLANQGGSGGVTIINQTTGRIDSVESRTLDNGEKQIIIREAVATTKSELTREIVSGDGTVVQAGQALLGWRRTGT